TGVVRGRLLLDRDRRAQPLDVVDVRLLHHAEELPRIGRQGLDVAPLSFRVDGVARQRRLAGPGQAGAHDQLVARQVEVDVLEVVCPRAADLDGIHQCGGLCGSEWTSLSERPIWGQWPRRASVWPAYPGCGSGPRGGLTRTAPGTYN